MASQGDIDVLRSGYEAMQRGDVETLVELCDPEVEFVALVSAVEGASYRGHDGIRRFFNDLGQAWEEWLPVPAEFSLVGDSVLVMGTTSMRGKGSGVEMEMDWGQVFEFRGGKVVWTRIYADREEAAEAAHLKKARS